MQYKDELNWDYISKYQKLSEDFIRCNQEYVNWLYISIYQKLSESFIDEFKYELNMNYVCKYQKLSEDFITNNMSYNSLKQLDAQEEHIKRSVDIEQEELELKSTPIKYNVQSNMDRIEL